MTPCATHGRIPRRFTAILLAACVAVSLAGCGEKPPSERLDQALVQIQEGQVARGVIELKRIVADHPDDPAAMTARLHLGDYYFTERNAPAALEQYEPIVDGLPFDDPRAQAALERLLGVRVGTGNPQAALDLLDRVKGDVGDDPAITESLDLRRTDILMMMGEDARTTESLNLLATLMNEAETDVRHLARESLARFWRSQGEFERSNDVYRDYLEQHPGDPLELNLQMAIAANYKLAGDDERARAEFAAPSTAYLEAIEAELDQRTRGQMLLELAQYHRLMQDWEEAETLMRRFMGYHVRDRVAVDTQLDIIRMYINEARDFDRAEELLDQVIQENPENNIGETGRAWLEQLRAVRAAQEAEQEGEGPGEGAPAGDEAAGQAPGADTES